METLSFVASCLVLLTYVVKNQKVFRIIAIVSGAIFSIYAIAMGLPSMIFMNVSCLSINVFTLARILIKEKKDRQELVKELVEVCSDVA